jgi:hypothetical protein
VQLGDCCPSNEGLLTTLITVGGRGLTTEFDSRRIEDKDGVASFASLEQCEKDVRTARSILREWRAKPNP